MKSISAWLGVALALCLSFALTQQPQIAAAHGAKFDRSTLSDNTILPPDLALSPAQERQNASVASLINDGIEIMRFAETSTPDALVATTVKLSPTSVSFGSITIGATSSPHTVTLTNVGTTTLSITGFAKTGANPADFAQAHSCGTTLAKGASCIVNVTFKPTASGTRTAALSISDSASGSPQKVPLSGTGVAGSCIPTGHPCFGPGLPHCCRAPFPHHSFCSSQTGWGVCLMN
jgi:hypothetical protein